MARPIARLVSSFLILRYPTYLRFIHVLTAVVLYNYILPRRVALHKYDPPDLVNTHSDQISNAAVSDEKDDPKTPNRANEIDTNVAKGLLVELTPHQQQQTPMEDTTPISVLTDDSRRRELDDDFKNAANNPINKLVGWGDMSDSDDDDDLL